MKQGLYTITAQEQIARHTWRLRLAGDTSALKRPGQFVNVQVPGYYLRRPLAPAEWDIAGMTLVYKTVGEGTDRLSQLPLGTKLDLLTGLGNGFEQQSAGERPLLIGGGAGIPPLLRLCHELTASGKEVTAVLGFNGAEELFLVDEFKRSGTRVLVATVDGSAGSQGLVTDILSTLSDYSYFYSCGPVSMMRAVAAQTTTSGQFSLEERMGCGFGACMGCTIPTAAGLKRVCKEGPVFRKEDLLWT